MTHNSPKGILDGSLKQKGLPKQHENSLNDFL
jgi:hypothetical protein